MGLGRFGARVAKTPRGWESIKGVTINDDSVLLWK